MNKIFVLVLTFLALINASTTEAADKDYLTTEFYGYITTGGENNPIRETIEYQAYKLELNENNLAKLSGNGLMCKISFGKNLLGFELGESGSPIAPILLRVGSYIENKDISQENQLLIQSYTDIALASTVGDLDTRFYIVISNIKHADYSNKIETVPDFPISDGPEVDRKFLCRWLVP